MELGQLSAEKNLKKLNWRYVLEEATWFVSIVIKRHVHRCDNFSFENVAQVLFTYPQSFGFGFGPLCIYSPMHS